MQTKVNCLSSPRKIVVAVEIMLIVEHVKNDKSLYLYNYNVYFHLMYDFLYKKKRGKDRRKGGMLIF